MPLRPNMAPAEYLNIFRRRKWLIIFSFLFILFGASVYCVVVKEMFRSSTTILVIPQRVPDTYVRSTVSIGIGDRLATIQQQVLSRTRLISIMDELAMFKEERRKKPVDEIVDEMRKRISLQVRGSDAFTVSFVHETPQMAMLATSRIASLFIDENLKSREQQAVGTAEFLDSQLQQTKQKLEEQEARVKEYKSRFMGELPQQLEANLSTLTHLQDQLKSNADTIRASEDRSVFLGTQIRVLETQVGASRSRDGQAGIEGDSPIASIDPAQSLSTELEAKKSQLANLRAKYTERYPELLRIEREVAQLEQRIAEVRRNASQATSSTARPNQASPLPAPSGYATLAQNQYARDMDELRRLRGQLAALEKEVSALKHERLQIQKTMALFQAKVEASPRREQEMIALTRDYENLKRSYDDLLNKKLQADISENLEKRQKGEQFQILDPANLPEKPYVPARLKVFGIAFFASIMLGFGGAIGLEVADSTIRNVKEYKFYFNLPLLATIPTIQDSAYERRVAIRQAIILVGVILFTASVTIFLVVSGDKVRAILKGVMSS